MSSHSNALLFCDSTDLLETKQSLWELKDHCCKEPCKRSLVILIGLGSNEVTKLGISSKIIMISG